MPENYQDKLLYLRLRRKDREAFIKAYDLYLDNIYRFIYFKVSSKEEAEDLTSAVFLKAWDYIQNNQLKENKSLKALFYKIARNKVIDHYRTNRDKTDISLENSKLEIRDTANDLHKKIEIGEDWRSLEKVMFQLKDEYREIITLKYLNELSVKEIAEVLEKNKSNIRVILFRALNSLRELVNQEKNN